jgi:predicted MFS family arabinose efflux permease
MIPSKTPVEANGFRALMGNPSFLLLWGGQIWSQVADKILLILLLSLLSGYEVPPGWKAGSLSSSVMIASTIPAILFGSAAGIAVDRWYKKDILVWSNYLRAALIIFIPILPKSLFLLLSITFLVSVITQFFAPTEQSALPLMLPAENLLTANAIFTTTTIGSLIVGFAVGEPVLSLFGDQDGIWPKTIFVASLYFLAGTFSNFIRLHEDLSRVNAMPFDPWEDVRIGFNYLRQNRLVFNAIVQLTILYSTFAPLPILTQYLAKSIGLKETQFGFLIAAAGIGLVFGAGVLATIGNRLHHKPIPLYGFCLMAVMLAIVCFVQQRWLVLLLCGLFGFGAAGIAIPMQTLVQERTPEDMRGKVFGFQNNVVNIALSVPLAIAGPVADRFGVQAVLGIMSFGIALAGFWTWQTGRRFFQNSI